VSVISAPFTSRSRRAEKARELAGKTGVTVTAFLSRLAPSFLTVSGLGCIDAAAFVGNVIAGLVVTGFSLVLLEAIAADED
jgi:hypothetical protein